MKMLVACSATALALLGAQIGLAQDKSAPSKQSQEVQSQTKSTNGNAQTMKTSNDMVRGKVETYEPGKSLKVTIPGKTVSTRSFDLNSKDWTYHVSKNIRAGQWVTVNETTDNNGHKTLTVRHSTKGQASRTASE